MTTEHENSTRDTAPATCYRHKDRETLVQCGRCGKPLCPDCMRHGPVGVRCDECLRPASAVTLHDDPPLKSAATEMAAIATAIGVGTAGVLLLIGIGVVTHASSPNLLLSVLVGILIGWSCWRRSGRAWNPRTARITFALGMIAPIIAALTLGILVHVDIPIGLLIARTLVTAGVSGMLAWLFATQRNWGGAFDK